MRLRIAGKLKESVVDGPGIRMVIFTQGCPHRCPSCHNPHTHDPLGGEDAETEEIAAEFMKYPHLKGLTVSGGEPFLQARAVWDLTAKIKESRQTENLPDIIVYTGYVWERLIEMSAADADIMSLIKNIDILVDGPFIEKEKRLDLAFRGSSNQRVIDVRRALQNINLPPPTIRWGDDLSR